MNEETVEKMLTMIDSLFVEQIGDSQDNWKVPEEKEQLIYTLAFNDGLLTMALRVKKELKNLLPKKFEEAEDDQS